MSARDHLNKTAVAGRGHQLIEAFGAVHAAMSELQRTLNMIDAIHELVARITSGKHGLDAGAVDGARGVLARWAGRPLDLAFLRAAIGPLWGVP